MQEFGLMSRAISNWSVDYSDGEPHPVTLPHAWRHDVDVRWEGPAIYGTEIDVPSELSTLHFQGVSYEAVVTIDGSHALTHRGIWDSFEVDLEPWQGKRVKVEVAVIKNGGQRFPVKEVASGFLPFVFHTFGGIWGEVTIAPKSEKKPLPHSENRVFVDDSRIFVDGAPFYVRGLLHWGWYPELGHHNAPEETIRREVQEAKRLGFNLIKFCLWAPPERYFEILREEGMEAWLELPLWDPTGDPDRLDEMAEELERIIRQYRSHANIILWTIGCELSHATPPEFRERMVDLVRALTGCPLVKDNSGGAEMYGGDLREFGYFEDFHPYCDTQFYPLVLDSLLPGPRPERPTLLGEFNDIDVHRDLNRLHDEMPYWASAMPELNDQGVRWQHDLPAFLANNPMALGDEMDRHERLMASSREKAAFMRKRIQEWVRARDPISGYVITGFRDTPISTSGFFDDWGKPRFTHEECAAWNSEDCLFLIPSRRPPWVDGGNRAGWLDPHNQFTGQVFFRVGLHSESGADATLIWRIEDSTGKVQARGVGKSAWIEQLRSRQIGEISWHCETPGEYRLIAEAGHTTNSWTFFVESPLDAINFQLIDPRDLFGVDGGEGDVQVQVDQLQAELGAANELIFLESIGTRPAPFWRESAYEFHPDAPFAEQWDRLLAVSGDRVIDPTFIAENSPSGATIETLINRIDVRTYQESPVMMRVRSGGNTAICTTLRPYGGLGIQPSGLKRNAAGCALMTKMLDLLK